MAKFAGFEHLAHVIAVRAVVLFQLAIALHANRNFVVVTSEQTSSLCGCGLGHLAAGARITRSTGAERQASR